MKQIITHSTSNFNGKDTHAVKLQYYASTPETWLNRLRFTASLYMATLLFMLMLSTLNAFSQKNESLRVENGLIIVRFDKEEPAGLDQLLTHFGLKADSLWSYKNIGKLPEEGWKIYYADKNVVEIAKPMDTGTSLNWGHQPIYFEQHNQVAGMPGYPKAVKYGNNSFKAGASVYEDQKDQTVFFLRGYTGASKVILSGNFNNWSTSAMPMKRTDSGWIAIQKLKPGKYLYKFIVDGQWIHDLNNLKREADGASGNNSVYFHTNYVFRLPGFPQAKRVIIAGSFNNWNEKELVMQRVGDEWQLPVYLSQGTHAYKFIVDKEWILDPLNKVTRPDGHGNFNSYMSFGDTISFTLNGYTQAHQVILAGSFNDWNTAELSMSKTKTGWEIPYVLAPGTYEYKFIVDGKWITDPDNPLKMGAGEEVNSVRTVKPNYTFVLRKFPNAREVFLSGSFNNWAKPGYPMQKKDGVWSTSVYLPAGKYTYKFVVDGKWIIDPDNSLYDENEYGTGNSVLWVEPEKTLYDN